MAKNGEKRPRFEWRHQYADPESAAEQEACEGYACCGESLTQQQFAKDADINELVRRFGAIDPSRMPAAPVDPSAYGDVPAVHDLASALHVVHRAQEAFMQLPAQLRLEFGNDPAEFHRFVTDPENRAECVKRGLLAADPVVEPVKVSIVQPEGTSSAGGAV